MTEQTCPICKFRVTPMAMAQGLAKIVGNHFLHVICLEQFQERTGREWSVWEIVRELSGG